MARKRISAMGGVGPGAWLNTYADMVTLLLTFFVLLFSMSSMDAAKFNMMAEAFSGDGSGTGSGSIVVMDGGRARAVETGGIELDLDENELIQLRVVRSISEMYDYLQRYIQQQQLTDTVEIARSGDDTMYIRLADEGIFEPNSATLRPEMLETLGVVGTAIKNAQGDAAMIAIIGHTAAVKEDANYPVSDWTLSSDRANTVLKYLEDNIGIDSSKLLNVSWGKNNPIAPNDTEANMARNRRVEILISGDNLLRDQLENIYEKMS